MKAMLTLNYFIDCYACKIIDIPFIPPIGSVFILTVDMGFFSGDCKVTKVSIYEDKDFAFEIEIRDEGCWNNKADVQELQTRFDEELIRCGWIIDDDSEAINLL